MKTKTKDTLAGYAFISPVVLGILIFTLGPMLYSLYLSFTEYDILSAPVWKGLDNYKRIFADAKAMNSLKVTLIYAAVSVTLGLFLSFFLALLVNKKVKGIRIFRTIFYTPVIIPAVAASFVWADLYNVQFGILNQVFIKLGLGQYPFISSPKTALISMVIFSVWSIGGSMLIWLAGLNGVPQSYYEVADIDGASKWTKMVRITLPMVSPVIFYNLIMGIIGGLQSFTQAFIMTDGGPLESTNFLVLNIYKTGFKFMEMGYASAQAWVLFAIILVLTLVVFKSSKWVFYGDEGV